MTQQPFSRPGAIDLSGLTRPAGGAGQAAVGRAGGGGGGAGGRVVVLAGRHRGELPGHRRGLAHRAGAAGLLLAEPAAGERADGARPGDGGRGVRGPVPGRAGRHRRPAGDRPGGAAAVGAVRVRRHRRPAAAADPGRADPRQPARRHQPGDAAAHHPGHHRAAPAAPGRAGRRRGRGRRAAARPALRAGPGRPGARATTTPRSRSTRSSSPPTPPTAEAAAGLAMATAAAAHRGRRPDGGPRGRGRRAPTTSAAQTLVADLDMLDGQVDDAFDRLVDAGPPHRRATTATRPASTCSACSPRSATTTRGCSRAGRPWPARCSDALGGRRGLRRGPRRSSAVVVARPGRPGSRLEGRRRRDQATDDPTAASTDPSPVSQRWPRARGRPHRRRRPRHRPGRPTRSSARRSWGWRTPTTAASTERTPETIAATEDAAQALLAVGDETELTDEVRAGLAGFVADVARADEPRRPAEEQGAFSTFLNSACAA